MTHYQSHHAPSHGHAHDYYGSDPSLPHHHKKSKSPTTPRKLEEDLRSTISFLVKALQKEFLKSTNPGSTATAETGYGSSSRATGGSGGASGGEFQEVLYKGKKKLEKLVKKYREVAGASNSSGSQSHSANYHHDDGYGYGASNTTPAYGAPGYVHTPDDIEEVESVRSSARHHRSNRNHHHHDTSIPRAPSPPYTGPYGRTVYDGENPDYHNGASTSTTKKNTSFSLDNINLPLLIERAAVVLGIIEKVLVMKAGSSSSHGSRSGSGSHHHGSHGSGGAAVGIVTAVKIVRMILALSEGAGNDGRRHTR